MNPADITVTIEPTTIEYTWFGFLRQMLSLVGIS